MPSWECWRPVLVVPGTVEAQPKDAASVLAAARQALGGEKKLAAVKSFTATGRTRQVRGDNLVPIEFEIFVELPDKYLRKDEIPAQESGPTASGFTGDELLQDPLPAGARCRTRRVKARVLATLKQDFARLALGMFAASFPAYPLTFTYVGQAEAPQGKADVLDAKGPDNFTLRYFINSETHLPIMVAGSRRRRRPRRGPGGMPRGPGRPPGAGPPAGRARRADAAAGRPGAPPPVPASAERLHRTELPVPPAAGAASRHRAIAPPGATPRLQAQAAGGPTRAAGPAPPRRGPGRAAAARPENPPLLRRLPRRRRPAAPLPAAARDRRRHHRRNHVRPLQAEREDRSAKKFEVSQSKAEVINDC